MLILCWASVVDTKGLHSPNVFLMLGLLSQTMDQRQCIVLTMTQRWVYVNPQSEMMSQHQTKSGCSDH